MPDITSALDDIRERNERYIATQRLTAWTVAQEPCGDVRRLLAAVDAVLGLHQPHQVPVTHCCSAHSGGSLTGRSATLAQYRDEIRACPDCFRETVTECRHCDCSGGPWPCEDVRAISRALLGEERADG